MDIRRCIPKDKHDVAALERAATVGFPLLNQVLPDLLAWLQDANWPVAAQTASLLSGAHEEIVPHIKAVLNSEDGIWKYWTIQLVVKKLNADVLKKLQCDLIRLANQPTQDDRSQEVDIAARSALAPKIG